MLRSDQTQEVGSGGKAVQAGRDAIVISAGLSYEEARCVALDVFRANFLDLATHAMETANARANEITERFLSRLFQEHPSGFREANSPDFQLALYSIQKEYAKSGDKDLGELLVELLVDRSKQAQRDIRQLVLSEAMNIVPRLTENQVAALSLVFLFKNTESFASTVHDTFEGITLESFGEYLDRYVYPLASKLANSDASLLHLQHCGCGAMTSAASGIEAYLENLYVGLFSKGVALEFLSENGLSAELVQAFCGQCRNDSSKVQVLSLTPTQLTAKFDRLRTTPEDRRKVELVNMFGRNHQPEIRRMCIETRPYMAKVFDAWLRSQKGSRISGLNLSNVGIAIAHANIKRYVRELPDLSNWVG